MFDKILHFTIARAQVDSNKQDKENLKDTIFWLILSKKLPQIDEMDDTHENLTPLGFACFTGVVSLAKILIENGADVNSVTETNLTPIGLTLLWRKEADLKNDEIMMNDLDGLIEVLRSKGGVEDWKKEL